MDFVIATKLSIAAIGICAALLLARSPWLLGLPPRDFSRILYAMAILARAGLFTITYIILGFQAQSDAFVYYDWSQLVLNGRVPGESEALPLHYGPLFLYFTALPLLVINSSRAIVAWMIAIELLSIPVWFAVARIAFGEIVARRAMLLYVASPFTLLTSVIGANNDVMASLFVAVGLWLFLSRRQLMGAFVLGLGVVCSKLLVAAILPAQVLKVRRPFAWCGLLAAMPLVTYGAWIAIGIDPIAGLRFHSQHFSSGNIPYLMGLLDVDLLRGGGRTVANALGLIIVIAIFAAAFLRRNQLSTEGVCALFGALFSAFMLTSAKAFAHYWLIALVPVLCVLAGEEKRRWPMIWYAAFSFSASVESTLWYRLLDNMELSAISWDGRDAIALWLFLPVETILVSSYCAILVYCCRRLIRAH